MKMTFGSTTSSKVIQKKNSNNKLLYRDTSGALKIANKNLIKLAGNQQNYFDKGGYQSVNKDKNFENLNIEA